MAVYAAWAGFKEKKVSKDVLTTKHAAITNATCKVTAAGWVFEAACSIFSVVSICCFLQLYWEHSTNQNKKRNNTHICLIFDMYEAEIILFSL